MTRKLSHYGVLGLLPDASDDAIRRAYKGKALQYHPDKNPAPDAADMFILVSEAFYCLKDPLTRAEYDKTVSGRAHTDLSDDVDSPVDGQHQNREIDEDFTFEGKRHFQFCDEAKQWRRPASSSAQRATSSASAAVPDVPAFASSCGRARNFTTATKFGSAKSFLPQKGTTKSFSSSFASVPDVWTSLSLCDGGSKENVALRSTLRKWKELWRQEIEQEEYEAQRRDDLFYSLSGKSKETTEFGVPILRSRAPVDIMKSVWDRQKQMDTSREQPHAYTLRGAHYGTSSNTETTGASKGPDSADDPQHKLNGTGSLTAGTSRALLAGKTPAQSHSVAAPASSSVLVVPENASHSMTSEFRQRLIAGARFKVKGTKPTFISLWCNSNLSSLQWRLSGSSSGQPDGVLLLSSIVKVIPLRRKDSNNWLSIVSIDKTMTVEAPCREERDAWVQSLNVAANLPA